MFSWFKSKALPKQARQVDVGKVTATISAVDGRTFLRIFIGDHLGMNTLHPTEDRVYDGWEKFQEWRADGGKTGTLRVGNNVYVPLAQVKDVTVTYSEYLVEVEQ